MEPKIFNLKSKAGCEYPGYVAFWPSYHPPHLTVDIGYEVTAIKIDPEPLLAALKGGRPWVSNTVLIARSFDTVPCAVISLVLHRKQVSIAVRLDQFIKALKEVKSQAEQTAAPEKS